MEVQYISDIHLEFMNLNEYKRFKGQFQPRAKVLVLAGDIGNPYLPSYTDFLSYVNTHFEKVFLIAGNHEFYGNCIEDTILLIHSITSTLANVTFLDNAVEEYGGFRWVGTTLWSEIINSSYTINDTKIIKDFTVEMYNELHSDAVEFLEDNLGKENTIVITHHLPIYELTLPQFRSEVYAPYNQWFHANLNILIQKYSQNVKGWFYGHTHAGSVQTHYQVPFYCAPKGYPNEKSGISSMNVVCKV